MADVLHQVGMSASQEQLFSALTQESEIKQWWSEHSSFKTEVGSEASVSFYGGMVEFKLRVAELEPGKKVVWNVEGGPPDWENTVITWTLSEGENGQTSVHLAHTGFPSTEGNFAGVNYNWGWYMTSLMFYLQKGEGMPHTDADMPA
ncbi:MAG: SRPBCC domain-containing protein [Chloroflexi bacterium]|nr:MAG: SRPBCC domain-containing protein [Chloroflexota bacterium]MBL1194559.1 SRPBCC domain-containing protein [Chloroflexota bacterium]NOH11847.1 SRPBCC domain-containing protein [Chloroflexota bacterium]